jgi:hypothetical protein
MPALFLLTEAECLVKGGHCWVVDDVVSATNPPLYHRRCKHCPRVEHGQDFGMQWTLDESETKYRAHRAAVRAAVTGGVTEE